MEIFNPVLHVRPGLFFVPCRIGDMDEELAEYKNPGSGKVNGLDQKLIRWYGVLTPEEIAEKTGLESMDVIKRTEELIGRRDYLGEAASVRMLLMRLETAAAELESRLPGASDRNASAIGNSIGGLLGRSLGELRKIRQESQVDADAVKAQYAQMLVGIVEKAGERVLGRLQERYKDVDSDDLTLEFHEAIMQISREYDAE